MAVQPPLEVTAIVFGIGAALTLDEFALWLHLDDVYWSEQGRQSIDAVIVFAIVSGFMVLGVYPVSFDDSGSGRRAASSGSSSRSAIGWSFVVVCFMKGKLIWGVLGHLPARRSRSSAPAASPSPSSSWAQEALRRARS